MTFTIASKKCSFVINIAKHIVNRFLVDFHSIIYLWLPSWTFTVEYDGQISFVLGLAAIEPAAGESTHLLPYYFVRLTTTSQELNVGYTTHTQETVRSPVQLTRVLLLFSCPEPGGCMEIGFETA